MRSLPEAEFEIGCGLGALSGLLSGLVLGALGSLSSGNLGDGRLSEVGTIMPATGGCAVGVLTLVTMLCGFVIGLSRRLRSEESRQGRAERRQERKKNHAVKAEKKARNRAVKKKAKAEQKAAVKREAEAKQDKVAPENAIAEPVDDEALGHDIYDSIQHNQDAPDDGETMDRP